MTEERLPLNELLRKAGDGDFLRAVAKSVLQLLMEADVEGLIGCWPARTGRRSTELAQRLPRPHARHAAWLAQSHESRSCGPAATSRRSWRRARSDGKGVGRRHPGGLDRRGVGTRRVDEIAQAMGLSGSSKIQVSKLCKEIDERVKAFLERPLEGDWPYLWLDATYLKVREGGRIVSVAAIIAVAANTEGRREIVGLGIESVGSRDLLGGLPEAPHQTRPARRQACDLGRARRAEGRRPAGRRRDMATLSRALHAQCAGLRAKDAGDGCRRRHPPGLHPARSRDRGPGLAARRRSAAAPVRETRQVDGRGRA